MYFFFINCSEFFFGIYGTRTNIILIVIIIVTIIIISVCLNNSNRCYICTADFVSCYSIVVKPSDFL